MEIRPASSSNIGNEKKRWQMLVSDEVHTEKLVLGDAEITADGDYLKLGDKVVAPVDDTCIRAYYMVRPITTDVEAMVNVECCFPAEEIVVDWGDGQVESKPQQNKQVELILNNPITPDTIYLISKSASATLKAVPEGYTVPFTWSITSNNSDPVTDYEIVY